MFWSMKDYTCHYVVSTKKAIFTLLSIKIIRICKIVCLHLTAYLKTWKSFPICMFVVMASGKCDLLYISLFYKNLNLHTTKEFNFFRIIYGAMFNNQFSEPDNVKMTCQTHKY